MKKILVLALMGMALVACGSGNKKTDAALNQDFYGLSVSDASGNPVSLSDYAGKVLLIVNTATRCGFTPQYTELEALYEKYRESGLEILDFPCNQFGGQAPGTAEEILEFCTGNYNIQFTQFAKIDVNGDNADPLFTYLKSQKSFDGFDQANPVGQRLDQMMRSRDAEYDKNPDIKWNFTKFLVDRQGKVVSRFEPMDGALVIEPAIAALL